MTLDNITQQEIQEYEAYCKQQEQEFVKSCSIDWIAKEDAKDWKELEENADYYND